MWRVQSYTPANTFKNIYFSISRPNLIHVTSRGIGISSTSVVPSASKIVFDWTSLQLLLGEGILSSESSTGSWHPAALLPGQEIGKRFFAHPNPLGRRHPCCLWSCCRSLLSAGWSASGKWEQADRSYCQCVFPSAGQEKMKNSIYWNILACRQNIWLQMGTSLQVI